MKNLTRRADMSASGRQRGDPPARFLKRENKSKISPRKEIKSTSVNIPFDPPPPLGLFDPYEPSFEL